MMRLFVNKTQHCFECSEAVHCISSCSWLLWLNSLFWDLYVLVPAALTHFLTLLCSTLQHQRHWSSVLLLLTFQLFPIFKQCCHEHPLTCFPKHKCSHIPRSTLRRAIAGSWYVHLYFVYTWPNLLFKVSTASPQVMSFCSSSLRYNVDEKPGPFTLVYVYRPVVKVVSFDVVSLRFQEPVDDGKWGLTVCPHILPSTACKLYLLHIRANTRDGQKLVLVSLKDMKWCLAEL